MSSKILIVDDEPDLEFLINMNFNKQIKAKEYNFVYAQNGIEALQQLKNHDEISVVFTDINMPQMDGLTLLGKINENFPLLRTVIVSAYGDMSNIRTALNLGAFDFVTKPIDLMDLEKTLTKSVREAKERRSALNNRQKLFSIENDLNVATKIQTSILPQTFPPFPERKEFELYAEMTPAREVGGDFYDFFFVDKDRLGFLIGDVSGKGVAAALFMAVSRTFLKATALIGLSPRDCLERINRSLYKESLPEMFVTMFYGILDITTGEIRYSNGGHNTPYILRKNGDVEGLEETGGIMVGAMEASRYKENEINLYSGDTLILYTDGVTEAFDPDEEEFGDERLIESLKKSAGLSVKEIIDGVSKEVELFSKGAEQSDDFTMLTLKYLG